MASYKVARRDWTKRRGAMLTVGAILVADLALGAGSASLAIAASITPAVVPMAAAAPVDSSKTVAWDDGSRTSTNPNYEYFKNLTVTVGQTEALSNQGIDITWAGGTTTSSGEYATDYLQIMQCWGDQTSGPEPTQCQWGAAASNLGSLMGSNAPARNLTVDEDPAQTYGGKFLIPPPRNNPNQRAYSVPFETVKGESTYDTTTYFSTSSTNEVTAARTGEDGTGALVFETQTSLEAPHLGCGGTVSGQSTPRACWLVVVPRGEFNADGSAAADQTGGRLTGSPLSATNWNNRIQVKLGFEAIGASCPIGNAEQRTVGSELISEAFTSWQTTLCGTGTTYGFSQIGDGEARRQVVSTVQGASGLAFISEPLDEATAAGATLEYAPVAASAVVVGFNIERNLRGGTPNFSKNGTAITELTLNQRLVAKLLTQSYRADVPNGNNQAYLANNPRSIRNDPEFLELNPEFNDFNTSAEPDGLMVSLGSSDATALLWDWMQADADANDFLRGIADENGMVVNPAYLALSLATDETIDSFPKADLTTFRQAANIPAPGFGTLDLRPYVLDMHEGAYRARRADGNVKIVWDDTKNPPSFVSTGPQLPGARFSLTITDTTSAERYGLQTAKLVNAAGRSIEPTDEAIMAGIDALVPSSVEGVVVADPDKAVNAAYPLSMLTYAAVNVCSPTIAALKDYNKLISYATNAGQVSGVNAGQLPLGYVPLTAAYLTQAKTAQKAITAEIKKPVCEEHQKPEPVETSDPVVTPPVADIPPIDEPEEVEPEVTPSATPAPVALETTPASSTSFSGYAFLAALLLGLPCLILGPVMLRLTRR